MRDMIEGTIFDRCEGVTIGQLLCEPVWRDGLGTTAATNYRCSLRMLREHGIDNLPLSDEDSAILSGLSFTSSSLTQHRCAINYAYYLTGVSGGVVSSASGQLVHDPHEEPSIRSPHPDWKTVVRRCVGAGHGSVIAARLARVSMDRVSPFYLDSRAGPAVSAPSDALPKPEIRLLPPVEDDEVRPASGPSTAADLPTMVHPSVDARLDEVEKQVSKITLSLLHPTVGEHDDKYIQSVASAVEELRGISSAKIDEYADSIYRKVSQKILSAFGAGGR